MRRLLSLFVFCGGVNLASAHFIFVLPAPGGASATVIINEELKPSAEVDVGIIAQTKLSVRDASGKETPLTLIKSESTYQTPLPGSGLRVIHGKADLGMIPRGPGKPNVLIYYPKAIVGDAFDAGSIVGTETPIEIIPIGAPGALSLKVLVHGQPSANAEVTVLFPDGSQKKVKTDGSGVSEPFSQRGRYGAWARYWETASGERDGKKYEEIRHYATLVFDAEAESGKQVSTAARYATLPQPSSSFGGVVDGEWLYVYGGHIARTHAYSTASVSGRFDRLKLVPGATWESLPGGPAMQGMNLAAHAGKVYRIGGMSPRNEPGKPDATFSVADASRFDPSANKWESLPALPEPRSSHDVVVIGDTLMVVGGWTLKGKDGQEWRDKMETLDLSSSSRQWRSVPVPFKRRAMIAAAYAGNLWVLGGIDDHGKIVHDVSVYNPAKQSWTNGPALPGGEIDGFAPAACVHAGQLYVSVASGVLYRLDEAKQVWEKAGAATPRLAHRIVSSGKSILVIGGADNGNNSDLVEAISISR